MGTRLNTREQEGARRVKKVRLVSFFCSLVDAGWWQVAQREIHHVQAEHEEASRVKNIVWFRLVFFFCSLADGKSLSAQVSATLCCQWVSEVSPRLERLEPHHFRYSQLVKQYRDLIRFRNPYFLIISKKGNRLLFLAELSGVTTVVQVLLRWNWNWKSRQVHYDAWSPHPSSSQRVIDIPVTVNLLRDWVFHIDSIYIPIHKEMFCLVVRNNNKCSEILQSTLSTRGGGAGGGILPAIRNYENLKSNFWWKMTIQ